MSAVAEPRQNALVVERANHSLEPHNVVTDQPTIVDEPDPTPGLPEPEGLGQILDQLGPHAAQ